MFHASRLWYAARFYPIPPTLESELEKAFFDYINYPHITVTIKQEELHKLRQHGGAKLVRIQAKSEASKVQWLIDLCIDLAVLGHLALVTELLGDQKGKLRGSDLFFTSRHYARRILRATSPFTKRPSPRWTCANAFLTDLRAEKLFHNTIFTRVDHHTLRVSHYCERVGVFTYGQLLDEVALRDSGRHHRSLLTTLFAKLAHLM